MEIVDMGCVTFGRNAILRIMGRPDSGASGQELA